MESAVPGWLRKFSQTDQRKNKRRVQRENEIFSEAMEETDFMSDSLTASAESIPPSKLQKRCKSRDRPLKEIMDAAMDKGLKKPLDESNVGFRMVNTQNVLNISLNSFESKLKAAVKDGFSTRRSPWTKWPWSSRAYCYRREASSHRSWIHKEI